MIDRDMKHSKLKVRLINTRFRRGEPSNSSCFLNTNQIMSTHLPPHTHLPHLKSDVRKRRINLENSHEHIVDQTLSSICSDLFFAWKTTIIPVNRYSFHLTHKVNKVFPRNNSICINIMFRRLPWKYFHIDKTNYRIIPI